MRAKPGPFSVSRETKADTVAWGHVMRRFNKDQEPAWQGGTLKHLSRIVAINDFYSILKRYFHT